MYGGMEVLFCNQWQWFTVSENHDVCLKNCELELPLPRLTDTYHEEAYNQGAYNCCSMVFGKPQKESGQQLIPSGRLSGIS